MDWNTQLDREKNKIAAPAEEKENKSAENLSPINEEKENKTVEKTSNKQTESTSSLEDKLSGLKRMYDDGLITKEEYDTKRKELLDRF